MHVTDAHKKQLYVCARREKDHKRPTYHRTMNIHRWPRLKNVLCLGCISQIYEGLIYVNILCSMLNGKQRVYLRYISGHTGMHLMKQSAHSWYLPYCQRAEVCSHVSFIQRYVIPLSWCLSVFDIWVIAEWLALCLKQWVSRVSLSFEGSRFATVIHRIKQYSHNWYLLRYQCMEACFYVCCKGIAKIDRISKDKSSTSIHTFRSNTFIS